MKKKYKRILSGILATGLLISSLPANTVLAASQSTKTVTKYMKDFFSYTFKDTKGIKKITVNGKVKKIKKGIKNKKITFIKQGKYTIRVTNKKNKIKKYVFIVDKTKPTISGAQRNVVYNNNVTVHISDNYALASIQENGQSLKLTKQKTFTKTYSNNGTYRIVVKDKAGNIRTMTFTIHKNIIPYPTTTGTETPVSVKTPVPTTTVTANVPNTATPKPTEIPNPTKLEGTITSVIVDNSEEKTYTKLTVQLEDGTDILFITEGWYLTEENDTISYDIESNVLTVSRDGQEIYDINVDEIKEDIPNIPDTTITPTNDTGLSSIAPNKTSLPIKTPITTSSPTTTPKITPNPTKPSATTPVIILPDTTAIPVEDCSHVNTTTSSIITPNNGSYYYDIGYTLRNCKDCGEQIISDYKVKDWDATVDTVSELPQAVKACGFY